MQSRVGRRAKCLHSLRPQSIREEVEQSLRRLQTERIDLYQIHWPAWPASPQGHDPGTIEEAWTTLAKLRDEGKVAFIGVSNFDVAQLQRISRIETPTNLQPPYSMLRPEIEQEILPFCLRAQHRRDSVLADAVGPAHRNDDARADRVAARRRLAAEQPVLSGADALAGRWRSSSGCVRLARSTAARRAKWRLRGRCGTRRSPRRSSARESPQQIDELIGAATFRLSPEEMKSSTRRSTAALSASLSRSCVSCLS